MLNASTEDPIVSSLATALHGPPLQAENFTAGSFSLQTLFDTLSTVGEVASMPSSLK